MKKNYIILAVSTLVSAVGAVLKIMHIGENIGSLLIGICIGPYIFSIFRLVFSRANLNEFRNTK